MHGPGVAVERNIEAFLDLDVPVTKYVGDDGPALSNLRQVIQDHDSDPPHGGLDKDLGLAIEGALALDPPRCRTHAQKRSSEAATQAFFQSLVFHDPAGRDSLGDATASET